MILYPNMANRLINMYWQASGSQVPLLFCILQKSHCVFKRRKSRFQQYDMIVFCTIVVLKKKGHCQALTQVLSVFFLGGFLVVGLLLADWLLIFDDWWIVLREAGFFFKAFQIFLEFSFNFPGNLKKNWNHEKNLRKKNTKMRQGPLFFSTVNIDFYEKNSQQHAQNCLVSFQYRVWRLKIWKIIKVIGNKAHLNYSSFSPKNREIKPKDSWILFLRLFGFSLNFVVFSSPFHFK